MSSNMPILFCFPFAGGTANFYDDLERSCFDKIKFIKLEYPGHGTRIKTPQCHTFEELISDLYPKISEVLKKSPNTTYAMIGYSMGSIAMFNMLIKISKELNNRLPKCVFISAHRPTSMNMPQENVDEWLKSKIIQIGGIDERLLENKTFWRIYLPIYRVDYRMIANYDFNSIKFSTEIPAVIFYSEQDTSFIEMKNWENYFIGKVDYHKYEGQHFFIKQHYEEMAEVITRKMRGINE